MNTTKIFLLMVVFFSISDNLWAESIEDTIKPQPLKEAWNYLNTNKPSEAVKLLSEYKPDIESLAQYHFIYARAMDATKKSMSAVEHLRWAYLYLPKGEMKELSLLERADVYLRMKYFYEAKSFYHLFIKNFPDSKYIKRAHMGLAKSLTEIGLFRDALGHYEKAGDIQGAMFGRADALQRLGLVKEANDIYAAAILKDSTYIQTSDEALYYFGENQRLVGKLSDAKKYLLSVKNAPFKDRAEISLGLIAIGESRTYEATRHFSSALNSRDRQVKRQAILNLAYTQIKEGKINEAKVELEEIRLRYPYGRDYDAAVLMLSKLYKKEEKFKEAFSLLRELIFRFSPVKEAIDELEVIVLAVKGRDSSQFADLWHSAGRWLLDSSREQALLKIAGASKDADRPFFEIFAWLSKHGSKAAKIKGLAVLADFYAGIGDINNAQEYLKKLKALKGAGDEILRIEAKVFYTNKDLRSSAERLLSLKDIGEEDINLFGKVLASSKDAKKAVDVYESALKKIGGDSKAYISLADILYGQGKKAEALNYYRLALGKEPSNEWALYRGSILAKNIKAEEMSKKIKNDLILSKLAGARLKEINITRRMSEAF